MQRISTVDPGGPLARAIESLERLGCHAEAGEVRRLLVEWLRYREELTAAKEELAQIRAA